MSVRSKIKPFDFNTRRGSAEQMVELQIRSAWNIRRDCREHAGNAHTLQRYPQLARMAAERAVLMGYHLRALFAVRRAILGRPSLERDWPQNV